MTRPKTLTAGFVRTVKEPGRYGDGRGSHGLSLLVRQSKSGRPSRSWSQRLRIDGEAFNVGLGGFPLVTLAEARAKALQNRRGVDKGIDPRNPSAGIPTFSEAADEVIRLREAGWRNPKEAGQWRASLRDYAYPRIGDKPVSEITSADVLGVLEPIWSSKATTARRVRSRIREIMAWSIAQGFREDNPAGDSVGAALPKHAARRKHLQALPHGDVGGALASIQESSAALSVRLALRFLVLTAARSGEVRKARWDEIDLASKTWTIPAERMKGGLEHRVPLSEQALDVLINSRDVVDGSGLLFPSTRLGRAMSDSTPNALIKELNIPSSVHGFRSSFRDWAAEAGAPREIAEAALAHAVGNQVEAAYMRTDLLDQRREIMEKWGAYVTEAPEREQPKQKGRRIKIASQPVKVKSGPVRIKIASQPVKMKSGPVTIKPVPWRGDRVKPSLILS